MSHESGYGAAGGSDSSGHGVRSEPRCFAPAFDAGRFDDLSDAEIVGVRETERLWVEGVRLIDVRDPDRFAAGHIRGAVNIPLDRLLSAPPVERVAAIVYDGDGTAVRAHAQALREAIGELEFYA